MIRTMLAVFAERTKTFLRLSQKSAVRKLTTKLGVETLEARELLAVLWDVTNYVYDTSGTLPRYQDVTTIPGQRVRYTVTLNPDYGGPVVLQPKCDSRQVSKVGLP